MDDRVAIRLLLADSPGILNKALSVFTEHNIDLTSIKSRPLKHKSVAFDIDFHGQLDQSSVRKALFQLDKLGVVNQVDTASVPWFPTKMADFDHIGKRLLSEGDGI